MTPQRWDDAPQIIVRGPTWWERMRMVMRGLTLVSITYFGIIFVVIFNALERLTPLGIADRIIRLWGRVCLWLCGLRVVPRGKRDPQACAIVANHAGWIDIFTLLTGDGPHFVSKADVAGWPLVGWLSRQIGTVYIDRRRSGARQQTNQLIEKLSSGARLCFFPEATSTDGLDVVPFKTTLFAAFYDPALPEDAVIQPVSLRYHAPPGHPEAFYGWWGEMGLGPHLARIFALSVGGAISAIVKRWLQRQKLRCGTG